MSLKLYNLLAIVSMATVLATGGFCGYLGWSGRLSAERLETIAAVLRGEIDPNSRSVTEQPTTAPAKEASGTDAATEAKADRSERSLRSLRLERARRDIEARQRLLDQTLHMVMTKQEALTEQEAVAVTQTEKPETAEPDRGFEQELEYVSGLDPKQAKEHLVYEFKKHPADAVRLLSSLDVSRGKRILAQLKTPDELQIMSQLLEQLRLQNVDGYAKESGTTAGAASP
jgi:hypothetical protein